MEPYRFDTKCIQSGYQPQNGGPRTLPICQSTTFQYDDADALGQIFDLKAEGHMYTRISNPTVAAVEEKTILSTPCSTMDFKSTMVPYRLLS